MGLFSDFFHKEPSNPKDRRCINCTYHYYNSREQKHYCNNNWGSVDYRIKCSKSPNAITDCPKFDYKG